MQTRKQRYSFIRKSLGSLTAALLISAAPIAVADPNPTLISKNYFDAEGKIVSEKLILRDLRIDIDVQGAYAETTVLATFLNPTNDTLEGEFELDMPSGSTLTGYGLDINGTLRDGVIVEKKKAKRAFDERIRRGVDPGLAETTRDGAFTTRVFPILPEQARTVSVTFITPVSDQEPYRLPLESDLEPGQVEFTITGELSPGMVSLPGKFSPDWNEAGSEARLLANDLPLDGSIEIRPKTLPFLSVTRHETGRTFAAFSLDPADDKSRFDPNSIRVYWDTSLSAEADAEESLKFLSSVIDEVHPYSLQLVPFSDGLSPPGLIDLRPEGEELEHFTGLQTYDGATDIEALYDSQTEAVRADACFIVTDGRFTLGKFPSTTLPCGEVHTVSASPDADTGVLALLAKQGGGHFLNIHRTKPEFAAKQLDRQIRAPSRLLIDGRDMLSDAEWQEDASAFRMIVPVDPSARRYVLTVDGETMQGDLPPLSANRHSGAGASWAALRLVSERAKGASREDLIELSKAYSVVTDETSLLVLEDLWDYVENEIDLPDDGFSKAERAEYAEAIADKAEERAEQDEARLSQMERYWDQQLAWYNGEWERFRTEEPSDGMIAPSVMADLASPPSSSAPRNEQPMPTPQAGERRQERSVAVSSQDFRAETASEEVAEHIVVTGSRSDNNAVSEITIAAWSPDRPYLKAAEGLCGKQLADVYLGQRGEHGELPSYYLEMADVFAACGETDAAVRVALSALELPIANDDTLTAVSMRLMRYGEPNKAIPLLRKVVRNDPTRPQPWRDLALAHYRYAETSDASSAERIGRLEEALALLNHVIETPWDGKYDGIEVVAMMEANRIRQTLETEGVAASLPSEKLNSNLLVDLRIVVSWNVDETDMDLWVDEPTGERAIYSNPLTRIGGRLSNDMTEGYGPEEYLLKDAEPGTYEIYMDYYGSDIINPNGAVAIQAEIWRNWGSDTETVRYVDLEFTDDEESEYLIATVVIEGEDAE